MSKLNLERRHTGIFYKDKDKDSEIECKLKQTEVTSGFEMIYKSDACDNEKRAQKELQDIIVHRETFTDRVASGCEATCGKLCVNYERNRPRVITRTHLSLSSLDHYVGTSPETHNCHPKASSSSLYCKTSEPVSSWTLSDELSTNGIIMRAYGEGETSDYRIYNIQSTHTYTMAHTSHQFNSTAIHPLHQLYHHTRQSKFAPSSSSSSITD